MQNNKTILLLVLYQTVIVSNFPLSRCGIRYDNNPIITYLSIYSS